MKHSSQGSGFSSPRERQKAVQALEAEIQSLMDEMDRAYSSLGARVQAMSEQEAVSINAMADQVVALKQKLRKLKEKEADEV